ncbi:hypothetical protein, partial [Schlesneria sp.]|uniref:hypothetical protein n=1 Tax=Schlesneria sp. TaxID=2762018 RepID=UPI002F12BA53
MPTAPSRSSASSLLLNATKFVVLLGPDSGATPTMADEVDYLIPLSASISSAGRRDDVLTFAWRDMPRLVDTTTPVGMKRQIELRAIDENGDPTIVVGWGQMARQPQRIDESSEVVSIEARIGDQHFGKRLTFYPTWSVVTSSRLDVDRELVFNPEIDGVVRPNRSWKSDGTNQWNYVLDWDSIWTPRAVSFQQGTASLWTVQEVVLALCWWLNPEQTYIKNPTKAELAATWSQFGEVPPIKNVAIPYGASLPDALDALLIPLHMSWHLEHSIEGGERKTRLRFFQRGTGPTKQVLMQRPGESRDVKKTNILSFDASYSVIDLANRIECYGQLEQVELTCILRKGWRTTYDTVPLSQLTVGQSMYNTNPEIGRLWVLNESNEYDGLRPEITGVHGGDLDAADFTGKLVRRRRRFLRCLSQHVDADDRESNGYRVDWWDAFQPGATNPETKSDPGWKRVKWPFAVLEKQCGIMFDGETPPEELWRKIRSGNAAQALVRITATIVGDRRVSGIATRKPDSVNGLDMTLVLDVSDKFQKSKISTRSIYSGAPTEARDDTTAIKEYADKVQGIEDVMRLDCSIRLERFLHPELKIGDLLPKVSGRNLSLKLNSTGRAPQIIGFNMDCQQQC